MMTIAPNAAPPLGMGPVEKLQFLARAAAVSELSRVQLAVLVVLADMANTKTGFAWPSFTTLASKTGTAPRHVKRAVKGLIDCGALILAMPGNRVRSNRYRLNRAAFPEKNEGGGDTEDTTPGDDAGDTMVVTPKALGGDAQGPDVVTPRTPESIQKSEHKARIEGIDGEGAHACAGGPGGPLRLAGQPGQDAYPEFWEAFGARSTVSVAEMRLRELLADGADYGAIVGGARRYHAYNLATGGRKRRSADRWLQSESWRDDWTVRPQKVESETLTESPSRPAELRKAKGKDKSKASAQKPAQSPEEEAKKAERRKRRELDNREYKARNAVGNHVWLNDCFWCRRHFEEGDAQPCDEGARLLEAERKASDERKAFELEMENANRPK